MDLNRKTTCSFKLNNRNCFIRTLFFSSSSRKSNMPIISYMSDPNSNCGVKPMNLKPVITLIEKKKKQASQIMV